MVKSNFWIELNLPITQESSEAISNYMFELGSIGCYESDDKLIAYFHPETWDIVIQASLEKYIESLASLSIPVSEHKLTVNKIEHQDWNAAWKKTLQPIQVLPGLIIKPTWVEYEAASDDIIIEIDPQMAFGSGMHATTQLMLKISWPLIKDGQHILDIGTGSGILAIAAAKRKNCSLIAFDIDPIATETARFNSRLNHADNQIQFYTGNTESIHDVQFDLILANVNRSAIMSMLQDILRLASPHGTIILSGILTEEQAIIENALSGTSFSIKDQLQQDEWSAFRVNSE